MKTGRGTFKFLRQIPHYIGIPEDYPDITLAHVATGFAAITGIFVCFNYLFSIVISNNISIHISDIQNKTSFWETISPLFSFIYIWMFCISITVCLILIAFSKKINDFITKKINKFIKFFIILIIGYCVLFIFITCLDQYFPLLSSLYYLLFFIVLIILCKKITIGAKFILLFIIFNYIYIQFVALS